MNPTDAVQRFHLRNYELICSAVVVPSGRYRAALVVTRNVWPSRPRSIAMLKGDYATEAGATDSARAQGMAWICDFG